MENVKRNRILWRMFFRLSGSPRISVPRIATAVNTSKRRLPGTDHMKEGYWMNHETGQVIEIDEHELWLRRDGNAERLGVPVEVIARFGDFVPRTERDRFLTAVMSRAPVMRIRGHGEYITFEFALSDPNPALESIRRFCDGIAGPTMWLRIGNLLTQKTIMLPFSEFLEKYDRGEIAGLLTA